MRSSSYSAMKPDIGEIGQSVWEASSTADDVNSVPSGEASPRASEPSPESSSEPEAVGEALSVASQPVVPVASRPLVNSTDRVRRAVERAQAAMQRELQAKNTHSEVQHEVRRYLKEHGLKDEAFSPEPKTRRTVPARELEADEAFALNAVETPPESPYSSAEKAVKADLRVLQGKVLDVPHHQVPGSFGGM